MRPPCQARHYHAQGHPAGPPHPRQKIVRSGGGGREGGREGLIEGEDGGRDRGRGGGVGRKAMREEAGERTDGE